jgi:SAM domain (Sterile alpha motif)
MKHPKNFTVDEVCLFVFAVGYGDKIDAFREASIDGDMLVNLGPEDYKELNVSSLQTKKIERGIELLSNFANTSNASGDSSRIKLLEDENAALRAQLAEYQNGNTSIAPSPAPPPVPAPVPKSQPPPPPSNHHRPAEPSMGQHVVKGAVRGVLIGTVAGAVAGNAGKGAKVGVAAGATSGALNGIGARRRTRMRGF